jgi:hypothetical protein
MRTAWRGGWLVLAAGPTPALAHSPVPGIEGFYIGILHPFSTPAQALLMLGLGLAVGAFAPRRAGWAMGTFLAATLIGILIGLIPADLDTALFATAFLAAAAAALAPGRLLPVAVALALVGGVLIGLASVPDPGPTRDRVITMMGSFVGANLGLLYLFGFGMIVRERYTQPWVAIAFRVAAAWVGAISLLMLALRLAPGEIAV